MMKSRLTLWAAIFAVVTITAGCCCQAQDAPKEKAQTPTPVPGVQKPVKAVTPAGEVFWIISVWDAQAQPAQPGKKSCKTAKCFQTRDGKVLCVKPLKQCRIKGAAGTYKCCSSGSRVMTLEHDPAKAAQCKTFAAKEVKVCPKNGSKECKASEHVAMPGGKKGCAVKADLKQKAGGNTPARLDDDYDENDLFMITLVD